MNHHTSSPNSTSTTPTRRWLLAASAAAITAASVASATAQSYTVIDLTPNALNAVAKGIAGTVAGGSTAPVINSSLSRATAWDDAGPADLHPAFLADAATLSPGRSGIESVADGIQVGWGVGTGTAARLAPMVWHGSAASAAFLSIPFPNFGGNALRTDGVQIVGYAVGTGADGTLAGPAHAMIWDATTGAAIDLGDAGKGAQAFGVGGGAQVGYVIGGNANAALWRGSARSLVNLHPKNAVVSVANATDGVRQVGYAGYDVRVRAEAAKGNKDARFNYAFVWSGAASTAVNIHAGATVNGTTAFSQSYALDIQGSWIVGYAVDPTQSGTAAVNHAIVWDSNLQPVDLNAFLPAGFVGSIAYGVDDQGQIAGVIVAADGRRHAALWVPQPAQ